MEINKRMEQTSLERRPSSMQVTTGFGPEREKFEKEQTECLTKAIKAEESSAKEKHVRRTIIGTWQERGCSTFWNILGRMPLPSQNVMCWKALMVFHKVLREGHPNCLKDSYVFRRTLKDLYSVYKFASNLYGQLVSHYLRALQCKVEFHHKYHKIPGSLVFNEENPFKIPYRDINDVFHFAVEIFDFQDLLLTLYEEIMKTLDKSKNNSQVHSAQCRIAPMVPLLKECSGLYDMIVCVMIRLHKCLPPDTVSGHRTRFNQQFSRLKQFIIDAASFQFITALTTIPELPDSPPNFLIHTMEQPKQRPRVVEDKPSTPIMPQKDDRDMLIEQLMREINELRDHLDYLERDAIATQSVLKKQIMQLKEELSQYKRIAEQACDENVFLKNQLEGLTQEAKVAKGDDAEKEKVNEMFNKLKQKYTILRDEHVKMIRQNAEIKRKAEIAEQKQQELQKTFEEREMAIKEKEEDIRMMQDNLRQLEQINQNTHESLEQVEQEKNEAMNEMVSRMNSMNEQLGNSEEAKLTLEKELEKLKNEYDSQIKVMQVQLEHLTSSKLTHEDARKSAEDTVSKMKSDNEAMKSQLEEEIKRLKDETEQKKLAKEAAEKEIQDLKTQLESQVASLSKEMERIQKEKLDEEQNRMQSQAALENLKSSSGGEISTLMQSLEESTKEKFDLLKRKEELTKELDALKSQYSTEKNDFNTQIKSLQDQISQELSGNQALSKEMTTLREEFQTKVQELSNQLNTANLAKSDEEKARKDMENKLEQEKQDKESKLLEQSALKRNDEVANRYALLASTVEQCKAIIKETVEQFDNPLHLSGTTCTAEYLKTRLEALPESVQAVTSHYQHFRLDEQDVSSVLSSLTFMTHSLSDGLLHGKATSHMASHEDSEDLTGKCKRAADAAMEFLSTVKQRDSESAKVSSDSLTLNNKINDLINAAKLLIPKERDNLEGVGDLVDEQINETAQLVADASARIEEMLKNSRQKYTGVQLEVNQRILDSCNGLMKAIRELIMRSKDLQEEIVAEGKGTASAKDFYKRHHKWTEGLLSAAKSVGWGASILVDAADKVVERKGKFEELVVASNEIAASTAQLVAASRVKASRDSERLARLMRASKGVGEATANVVTMVKTGAEMTEDAKTVPDYSKLSLTQAKRLEMDAQVRMLELESLLEKERQKLGRLRKAHYQIAAELGLIEEDENSEK
ncbi:huntingtin-interacting protein 1-like [Rhopilema esculentum]|uniref:huntingtin-interacting protein 1-like n=1 Tax=Rhopilema esculentum TaxID=499914 RepID=UPI0031D8AC20